MARKGIPSHLREFLESQIVRGSRGYEPIIRILNSTREDDLKTFLEFYEESVRDSLLDREEKIENPEDLLASQARKIQESDREKEKPDDKLTNLFRDLSRKD